ncbi:MAG: hypothetical protein K2X66_15030 [Cyanobacteria bacterium]|nr:hypothetical protein [Cyanobacteriota bacterium]
MRINITGKIKPLSFQGFSPTQKVIQELALGHYQPWVDLFVSEWKNTKEAKEEHAIKNSISILTSLNDGLMKHLDTLIEGFLASTLTQNTLKERIEPLFTLLENKKLVHNNNVHTWVDEINIRIMRALTLISTAKDSQVKPRLKL